MSVYKSRQKDAGAKFVVAARDLRKESIRIIKKFPASYRWTITNNMLNLATSIYTNSVKANKIFLGKETSKMDYELRHRYLMIAITDTDALLSEITFLYEMVDDGNNFFDSRADYDKAFQRWVTAGNFAASKLAGVVESDKKRWKNFGNEN